MITEPKNTAPMASAGHTETVPTGDTGEVSFGTGATPGAGPKAAGPAAPKKQVTVEVEVEVEASGGVEVRDHRNGVEDTSKWGVEEWIAAMQRDPVKYMREFALAQANGKLSDEAKTGAPAITNIGQQEFSMRMEGRALLSQLLAANHQLMSQIIGNIRG